MCSEFKVDFASGSAHLNCKHVQRAGLFPRSTLAAETPCTFIVAFFTSVFFSHINILEFL